MAKQKRLSVGAKIAIAAWKIICFIMKPIFYIIRTLCLWLPIIYVAFGYVLNTTYGFNPLSMDNNSILYLIGLGISIIVALVFFVQKKRKEKAKERSKHKKDSELEEESKPKSTKFAKERKEKRAKKEQRSKHEASSEREEETENNNKRQHLTHEDDRGVFEQPRYRESEQASYRREPESPRYREQAREQVREQASYRREPEPPRYREQASYPQEPARVQETPRYQEQPQVYFSSREENTLIHEYNNRFEVYRLVNGERKISEVLFKDDI